MVTVEILAEDGHLVMRFSTADDVVELEMSADGARELVNHLGGAILNMRTGVMT